MNNLNVELYGTLLGKLTSGGRDFDFTTDEKVFEKYPLASVIMSLAVPLNRRYTAPQRKRARNFFNELLPEGRNLRWMAQNMEPGERNTYGILRKYGKDIAGALLIYDPLDDVSSAKPKTEKADPGKIRYLLENMHKEPLANSPVSGKTSLGGVQGKIVLAKKNTSWYRVLYGYPSSHILKPVVPEYPTMIYDESFCMQLAFEIGLTEYPVWIENFDGADALVIERYDRDNNLENGRIHQEDFNQVLGAHGDEKYQEYGGKVSARRIAEIIEKTCKADVEKFAAQLIFSIIIGNLDMHAKNVSVFHYPDQSVRLTPVYDQVPLRHQNTDGRMALSIDGEYIHANLTFDSIIDELVSWKTESFKDEKETISFVRNHLESCYSALEKVGISKNAYPSLKNNIASFITNLLSGRRISP